MRHNTSKYSLITETTIAVLIFTVLFFYLGLDEVIFSGPLGIHFMRQTDSLSFAGIYFREGFEFFKPGLYNLKNIDGHAACEFPVLYYITSLVYLVTGQNFIVLKILNYLVTITGVICIYKLSVLLLKDRLLSALIALVLFTSTVFNYYSLNYLPDTSAFGFIMAGWYFFFRYYYSDNKKNLFISFMFFTIGSLIKVTYLINPLAILVLYLLMPLIKKEKQKTVFTYPPVLSATLSAVLVAAWNFYMIRYNNAYESTSFNTTAMPIWNISREEIAIVWDHFTNYWYSSYFARPVFHLIFVIVAFQVLSFRRSDRFLSILTLILFAGNLAFFILFYSQFKDHDYYFITFFPLIILLFINAFKTLKNLKPTRPVDIIIKSLFFIIIAWGINYSGKKLRSRYDSAMDDYSRTGLVIQANKPGLDSLGIPVNAKVIVAPDLTQNGGLLMLNRMGWNIERPEQISIERIESLVEEGAEYLVLVTEDSLVLEKGYQTGMLVYTGKGISIFDLEQGAGSRE